MIVYVVQYPYSATIRTFLHTMRRHLGRSVQMVYYEDLPLAACLPRGTWVFSDLERLDPDTVARAELVAERVAAAGCPVFNRPARVLRRLALSHALHAAGVNRFRAYPLAEAADARLPVFLRYENQHSGSISSLLHTPAEVKSAVDAVVADGADPADLLAVEFADTKAADGLYRKYSAFLIGDRFVPRHVLFSFDWLTKVPDVVTAETVAEEVEYLSADPHPHEAAVRQAFRIAKCEYGRIDYGVQGGTMFVWEINTNPTIIIRPRALAPSRRGPQAVVARRLCEAFDALPSPPRLGPVMIDPGLRAALGGRSADRWRLPTRRAVRSLFYRLPESVRERFRRSRVSGWL
jgi:hypothetical protein